MAPTEDLTGLIGKHSMACTTIVMEKAQVKVAVEILMRILKNLF